MEERLGVRHPGVNHVGRSVHMVGQLCEAWTVGLVHTLSHDGVGCARRLVGIVTDTTLAEYLADRGLPVSEPELVTIVDRLLGGTLAVPRTAPLTVADEAFMTEHSGLCPASDEEVSAAAAASTAELVALVATSLTAAQVDVQIQRDASTVRHKIGDGSLYAILVGNQRRMPGFQFTDRGAPLPGLGQVLATLPADMHPLEVAGFFLSPKPELEINGDATSPRAWLAHGGDVQPVRALAAGLGIAQ